MADVADRPESCHDPAPIALTRCVVEKGHAPMRIRAAKLEELNTMYVKGLITRDEYDAKKKEILDRM